MVYNLPLKPANVLRGITPTANTFDTNPTDLANCTDGDRSTSTGTGSKTVSSSQVFGQLIFDMGEIKTVIARAYISSWSTANIVNVYMDSSQNGSNYVTGGNPIITNTGTSEIFKESLAMMLRGRYLRLRFNASSVSGSQTFNAKIYEVGAYEVRP